MSEDDRCQSAQLERAQLQKKASFVQNAIAIYCTAFGKIQSAANWRRLNAWNAKFTSFALFAY